MINKKQNLCSQREQRMGALFNFEKKGYLVKNTFSHGVLFKTRGANLWAASSTSNFFITCKESRIENNRSFYGSFYLGPFDPGQSITIANALRRTLLSSLKGIAIVSVQIEGVSHEYSSVIGVRDSVLDILLNLKEIVFRTQENQIKKSNLHNVKPFYIGYLRVRGPGVVRAADLKLPPFIQIVDPEQYIATLAEDGFLNMKFILSEGKNYILQKQGKFNNQQGEYSNIQPTITKYKKQKSFSAQRSSIPLYPTNEKGIPTKTGSPMKNNLQTALGQNLNPSTKITLSKTNVTQTLMNPLMIDAIFAPVNKINYIIEYSEHKTIDNNFYKSEEINLLFNTLNFSTLGSRKEGSLEAFSNKETIPIKKSNIVSAKKSTGQGLGKSHNLTERGGISIAKLLNNEKLSTWEPTQLAEPNQFLKHNVVLEIWTNGSLHPREALYHGLKNLILLFSKLEQLQITSINFNYERNSLKLVKKLKNLNYTTTPLNNINYSSLYTP